MSPIPIVVVGRNPNIAKAVRQGLFPQYDVIHIILTVAAGVAEVPALLSGKTPDSTESNLGSRNYGKRPVAIALGGGFGDEAFNEINAASKDVQSAVWLRADMSRMGEMPSLSDPEAYGQATAVRVKKCLDDLKVGKEGGKTEGVYEF